MEINKVQWRIIAKGEKLPCDSFLMRKDGTIPSVISSAGVKIGQDAYYLPVEELRSFPKEESKDDRMVKFIKNQLFNIKKTITDNYELDTELTKAIDWLEKQGKTSPILSNPSNTGKVEQKPAEWSEEDEEIHRRCICAMRASACGFPEEEKFVEQVDNWLESLKGRVQLQQKQEWSEEDKKIGKELIDFCVKCGQGQTVVNSQNDFTRWTDWLKSLRPQNRWKPSDEQMDALDYYANSLCTYCDRQDNLRSLFNDLKKLK